MKLHPIRKELDLLLKFLPLKKPSLLNHNPNRLMLLYKRVLNVKIWIDNCATMFKINGLYCYIIFIKKGDNSNAAIKNNC